MSSPPSNFASSDFGLAAGAAHSQGDADYDHDVDGADFLAWQRQLDLPVSVAVATAVPEPASVLLLVGGMLAISFRRRAAVS